jgi:hypothetical protein
VDDKAWSFVLLLRWAPSLSLFSSTVFVVQSTSLRQLSFDFKSNFHPSLLSLSARPGHALLAYKPLMVFFYRSSDPILYVAY